MKKETHFPGNLCIWDICCFSLQTIPYLLLKHPSPVSFWGITINYTFIVVHLPYHSPILLSSPLTGNFPRKFPKKPTAHNAH